MADPTNLDVLPGHPHGDPSSASMPRRTLQVATDRAESHLGPLGRRIRVLAPWSGLKLETSRVKSVWSDEAKAGIQRGGGEMVVREDEGL